MKMSLRIIGLLLRRFEHSAWAYGHTTKKRAAWRTDSGFPRVARDLEPVEAVTRTPGRTAWLACADAADARDAARH